MSPVKSRLAGLTNARQREPSRRRCKRRLDRRLGYAAANAPASEARRNDLAVVDDEGIAGTQQIRQLADRAILQLRAHAGLHHQQPGSIPRRDWTQGNPLGRQLEVKQIGVHAKSGADVRTTTPIATSGS